MERGSLIVVAFILVGGALSPVCWNAAMVAGYYLARMAKGLPKLSISARQARAIVVARVQSSGFGQIYTSTHVRLDGYRINVWFEKSDTALSAWVDGYSAEVTERWRPR